MIRTSKKQETPAGASALPLLQQVRNSGQAVAITIDGRYSYQVEGRDALAQLMILIDRLEAVAGIRRGMKEMAEGKGRTVQEILTELDRQNGLSRHRPTGGRGRSPRRS